MKESCSVKFNVECKKKLDPLQENPVHEAFQLSSVANYLGFLVTLESIFNAPGFETVSLLKSGALLLILSIVCAALKCL